MAVTLTNIQTQITETELLNSAISALESQLGIWLLIYGDTPVPLWPFIALGMAIYDIISLLGGGKPKSVDTRNVIRAYNMSAYWPLHALASDLAEMLKNGAPISDSRPAIQAQFGVLKKGTVESLQSLSHAQPGPGGAGFWQYFQLIELSWQWSSNYQKVLDTVKALDRLVIGITQLEQQHKPPPPPPKKHHHPPPPPAGTPCDSGDPEADEILDLCRATQASLQGIETAILDLAPQNGQPVVDPCCAKVVAAIAAVTRELTVIAAALLHSTPEPHELVDLTPVVVAIQATATAIADYQPLAAQATQCLCEGLAAIATAITGGDPILDRILLEEQAKVTAVVARQQGVMRYFAALGLVDAPLLQLIQG